MKVILTQDVPRVGRQGDVVNVKPGFGRNFLIPAGKALPATPGNLSQLKVRIRVEETRAMKDRRAAEELAAKLNGMSCTIRAHADESDKLYGAVHERDIAAALEDQGVSVAPHTVALDEPIKMLGVYPVRLRLFADVAAEIRVWVIRD
ncbi:MAG: 50S ribosomal protein L9 [Candidatus Eisenbacteria bacterium]|nr:50S ribosomal protein L9 [Candidatus Eisenbacteria bacterium]